MPADDLCPPPDSVIYTVTVPVNTEGVEPMGVAEGQVWAVLQAGSQVSRRSQWGLVNLILNADVTAERKRCDEGDDNAG